MKKCACFSLLFCGLFATVAHGQTATSAATGSDRVVVAGPSGSADLYGSGNDDAFASYGIMTFGFSAADFGLATVTDLAGASLELTFNDRGFSDGTEFELFFTPDDLSPGYTGLTYEAGSSPSGIDPTQFVSIASIGTYALGFDITDGALGGSQFSYALDLSSFETDLLAEINAGSEFSLLLAATNDADDITFSGVGNTFDAGDPSLTISAVPEPGAALALIAFAGIAGSRRNRRRVTG